MALTFKSTTCSYFLCEMIIAMKIAISSYTSWNCKTITDLTLCVFMVSLREERQKTEAPTGCFPTAPCVSPCEADTGPVLFILFEIPFNFHMLFSPAKSSEITRAKFPLGQDSQVYRHITDGDHLSSPKPERSIRLKDSVGLRATQKVWKPANSFFIFKSGIS